MNSNHHNNHIMSNTSNSNGIEMGMDGPSEPYQTVRSMTPSGLRTHNSIVTGANTAADEEPRTPSSTGLIRLSLKKPMGIVFEPMYDPNQPKNQRGVRICDLPRTGAAALSRKLQVGDELLQINDTTVSRLTFDEIMDFIIEADPESVNLLFRRPRKDALQARQAVAQKLNAAANQDKAPAVKWVDDSSNTNNNSSNEEKKKSSKSKKDKKKDKKKKRSKKISISEEEETLQSKSTLGEESYEKNKSSSKRKSKKGRRGGTHYESESFLDMLIDTICSDSNNVCRDTFRARDEEYLSEEESFGTNEEDTYVTYEESLESNKPKKKGQQRVVPSSGSETQEESIEQRRAKNMSNTKNDKLSSKQQQQQQKYEDDGTLETVDSTERKELIPTEAQQPVPPLGLAPNPQPSKVFPMIEDDADTLNPAPIKEVEYDDRVDHGADVSVMESLGGPSLLIEKQRAAQASAAAAHNSPAVPAEMMEKFGLDFPKTPGLTREQTIQADPLKFYSFVVKELLQKHEPEKVRLLDKLLAKYKGREDHLIQKLSVRYTKPEDDQAFTDAVQKNKQSEGAAAAIHTAKERMQVASSDPRRNEWPEKETKEPEEEDDEDHSESGSDYSRESVDGTSPAVIAQVSELLNYVYGKTSVPGQIDRVSTIMRAYEGREAVLLELLETKALIKANKEKENAGDLPSFLRNTQLTQSNDSSPDLPPVTPMANPNHGGTVVDDISSMSGVSSPADQNIEVEAPPPQPQVAPMKETPKLNSSMSTRSGVSSSTKPPAGSPDKRKKKGLFGGLFGKKKKDAVGDIGRQGSRLRNGSRKLMGNKSVEASI
jgi:hypothetical protein